MLGLDLDVAMRHGIIQVPTDLLDINAEVELIRSVTLVNALMRLCDGGDPMGRVFEVSGQRRVTHISGLELEHTRHDRKTVLDPVSDLPEKHLLAG